MEYTIQRLENRCRILPYYDSWHLLYVPCMILCALHGGYAGTPPAHNWQIHCGLAWVAFLCLFVVAGGASARWIKVFLLIYAAGVVYLVAF